LGIKGEIDREGGCAGSSVSTIIFGVDMGVCFMRSVVEKRFVLFGIKMFLVSDFDGNEVPIFQYYLAVIQKFTSA
jgi:hypothetical protein